MENLILSCFPHSLPALDNHKPLWALSRLPTFATSFNHSITKKTRHIAGNGHTDGQRKSLLLETSHLLWSLLIWEKSRSRTIFMFVMQARQQKNWRAQGWRNIWEGWLFWVPGGVVRHLWWNELSKSSGTTTQTVCHMTPSGKGPSKFKRKENNLAFNPQLKFRLSWKVTCLRLTLMWSKLLCGVFHWKKEL